MITKNLEKRPFIEIVGFSNTSLASSLNRYCWSGQNSLPDIKTTEQVISAYDLYTIIAGEMLRIEKELDALLANMISYCEKNIALIDSVFNNPNRKISFILRSIGATYEIIDKDRAAINISQILYRPGQYKCPKLQIIYNYSNNSIDIFNLELLVPRKKMKISKEINELDLECIGMYQDQLKDIFMKIREFYKFYGDTDDKIKSKFEHITSDASLKNDLFNIEFEYKRTCDLRNVFPTVTLNTDTIKEYELTPKQVREYNFFIKGINGTIMKKTPVRIDTLSPETKKLIAHYRTIEALEKEKQPTMNIFVKMLKRTDKNRRKQ